MRSPIVRTASPVKPDSGITLVEILIAMGVMVLGLLGVAALFPVGGHYLRQGEISDRADAIAQAAVSDAASRGVLDPHRWVSVRTNPQTGQPVVLLGSAVYDGDFDHDLRRSLQALRVQTQGLPYLAEQAVNQVWLANRRAGSVFFIDPVGVAESISPQAFGAARPAGSVLPSVALFPAAKDAGNFVAGHPAWAPWAQVDGAPPGAWPVRRLSVTTGAPAVLNRPVTPLPDEAAALVGAGDDLTVQLNNYRGNPYEFTPDNPSQQTLEGSPGGPMKRLAERHYSWALTVVPTTPEARDALADSPQSHAYDVSAVVYHRRVVGGARDVLPTAGPLGGNDQTVLGERLVRAAVATQGVGGGRLFLYPTAGELQAAQNAESPLEDFRSGQWVLLLGPHPESGPARPLLFCQWYRVVTYEEERPPQPSGAPGSPASVFLRGPDWPWRPSADPADPASALANDLRMVIVPDVVAVHTRTLKLQAGSAWEVN